MKNLKELLQPFFWPAFALGVGLLSGWIAVDALVTAKVKSQAGPEPYITFAEDPVYVAIVIGSASFMALIFIPVGIYLIRQQIAAWREDSD